MTIESSSAGRPLRDEELSGLRPLWLLDRTARDLDGLLRAVHRAYINLAWTAAPGGSDSTRWRLCRTFDHGSIHTVANWVAPATGRQKSLPKPAIKGLVEQAADRHEIQTFAEVFDRLKQRRHDADYDHMTVFGHENARQAVRAAGAAIEALDAVYGEPSWQIFTSLVLLTSKVTDR